MRFGGICMPTQQSKAEDKRPLVDMEHASELLPYPIDMSVFLNLPHCTFDATGVPSHGSPTGYQPTTVAQYALAHWNQYLASNDEHHRQVFLAQAHWLVEHEVSIGEDAAGWPISFPHPDFHTGGLWLSALAQGCGISVLVRAYQLTREETLLEVVRRVAHTFEHDILDGGVSAPIGSDGVFFEEVAVYPAAHILSGFIFALFGLYDYVALTNDPQIEKLIARSLATMHSLFDEFDVGFWTRSDLLHRRLSSSSELVLQVMLLEALAKYSGCDHCSTRASHWKSYQRRWSSRLRYLITSRCTSYSRALRSRVQTALFPKCQASPLLRVCVSIPTFPVTGGILTVLEGVVQVTTDIWQLEYLTQSVGPQPQRFVIHRFGTAITSPWYFPFVWLYVVAGVQKLLSLLRHGAGYHIILPQDSVSTGAFSALAAKLARVRVVCIDHGDLSAFSRHNHAERITVVAKRSWPWLIRVLARWSFKFYLPSRFLLARISARLVDHYLIPGVVGDGVEEICQDLGVPTSRITRYPSMIDVNRHVVPEAATRASKREEKGIPTDAIVVAIICRLDPEKSLDVAIESISRALAMLSPELRARVRVIIAGDGLLRRQIEEDIHTRGLSQTCLLWGEASATEVVSLLGLSDIFLYTSRRGGCFAMAVLEAMASGCAVVASTEPISNAHLLAEGRGISVPAGDVEQTALALVRLVNDLKLCRRMGSLARDYIAVYHSPAEFRRTLMRATYWSGLDKILDIGNKTESVEREN